MAFSFSVLFLLLMAVAAHAALSSRDYWQSVLPDTTMPAAIRDPLQSDMDVHVEGVNVEGLATVHTNKASLSNFYQKGVDVEGLTTIDISKDKATKFYEKGINMEGMDAVDISKASVTQFYQKGVIMKKPPTHVKQTLNVVDTFNFFLEKDLHLGTKMRLDFSRISPLKPFIPRGKANSIPFSSKNLSLILDNFFVKSNSIEAKIINMTIQECEEGEDSIKETKFCATSLESLVDLVTSALGSHNVMAVSSEINKEGKMRVDEYIVATAPVQRFSKARIVVCHQQPYPYAVFYCHIMQSTRAYVVLLIDVQDGVKVDAVAVCHNDTSAWNPNHLAFQVLKVAPGTMPICHFLPQDGVIWIAKGEALLPVVFDN